MGNLIKKSFKKIISLYVNLKIIWKLLIGFGLMMFIVCLTIMINQFNIVRINNTLEEVITEELEPMIYINDIRSAVNELEVTLRDAMLNHDQTTLDYVKNQFLPNTVDKRVEYSFAQLIKSSSKRQKVKRPSLASTVLRSRADQRMNNQTTEVLKELQQYWKDYQQMIGLSLGNNSLLQNGGFLKESGRLRYYLIGGLDRLVETYYRQRAVVAKTEEKEVFQKQRYFSWIILTVASLLGLGVSFVTAGTIITPLRQITSATKKVGAGDLAVYLPEERNDEFGEVARCFNMMSGKLAELVGEIKLAVEKINENSLKLVDESTVVTSASQQLMKTMLQVANGADVQGNKVESIHESMQSITEFSEVVNQATHRVANLSESSVNKALEGEKAAKKVFSKITRMNDFVSTSKRTMHDLQLLSKEIQGMVLTVKEIADQTNLLSLNASIEAARAGEYGRGFGVVAVSIGDLAVRTKDATSQVTGLVKRIQNNFEELSQMFEAEKQEIHEGELAVSGLEQVFGSIIASAQEVNTELQEITVYTIKLANEHEEVLQTIGQISEIAFEHKQGTKCAANSVEQQFSYTQEIIGVSRLLAHWGDSLYQSVGKFKKDLKRF